MTQKVAVAVVHGVGSQKVDFAKEFATGLKDRFADEIRGLADDPGNELQVRGVYWARILAAKERELTKRLESSELDWGEARNIMVDLGGDALAYQLNRQHSPDDPPGTYEAVHIALAGTLHALADEAGDDAPLCIVAHSLGTVIASNYLWDLQSGAIPLPVTKTMDESPLEFGRTLVALYTMGSPIAVWSLRFPDFGTPISFPPPDLIARYQEVPREWVNIYDADDVIGYPLKCLNEGYERNVTEDIAENVGSLATMWNPASHVGYWTDGGVVGRVAAGLAAIWRMLNGG